MHALGPADQLGDQLPSLHPRSCLPATCCRFNDEWEAPDKYINNTRVKFTTEILAIDGNVRGTRLPLP